MHPADYNTLHAAIGGTPTIEPIAAPIVAEGKWGRVGHVDPHEKGRQTCQ
jgi:hypothetical protein